MGRFVPVLTTCVVSEKQVAFKMTAACMGGTIAQSQAYGTTLRYGGKACYDGKQCWQYKLVLDRPGAYCWTVPAGIVCARTVLVGGGGKPKCGSVPDASGSTCASAAGAGGAYSEKNHAVTGGSTYFCINVGRQEQDTTMSCNGSAVHTAGGASGCVAGVATGGDWNSCGGAAGYSCNYCGSSYSHYCGSCKCFNVTTCCGYCVVYQYTEGSHDGNGCCTANIVGGASAGSWLATCGGAAWCTCGYGGTSHGAVVGGGAGIGDWIAQGCTWHYSCCNCICMVGCQFIPGFLTWCTNCPPSAQGGGGTSLGQTQCRSWASQDCTGGLWKGGDGGRGGANPKESQAWHVEWGYGAYCSYPFGSVYCYTTHCYACSEDGPQKQEWWDIHDMAGSGAPGTVASKANCMTCRGYFLGTRPRNAGEGAGTGGIATTCCNPLMMGNMIGTTAGANGGTSGSPNVNWCKICQLGVCGWCDQAWLMQDALFPFFITCAGTLGGSGGVSWCGYSSKAGKGGGGGQAKCQFLCVCWGGAFDCCNGAATTPLAFPPCLLDQMVSNAGTGMAIIYYREA